MSTPLRVIYAGTPDFACPALQTLIDYGCELVAVFTQPDRPAGRGRQLQASPVKQLALKHQLRVEQPNNLRDDTLRQAMAELQPDLMVVAAFGMLLPQEWLDLPRYGCWNLHASLLPRWRGAAPIQRAIEAGDAESGMTLMHMELGLDTGPMLLRQPLTLAADETGGSLHDQLAAMGAQILLEGLERLSQDGPWHGEVQDDALACYAPKLSKSEAEVDWQQAASTIARRVRAFNPFPVCWTEALGPRLRIWQAEAVELDHQSEPGTLLPDTGTQALVACGQGALKLLQVQPAGKKAMPVSAWLNAQR